MKEYKYKINDTDYVVKIQSIDGNKAEVEVNGVSYKVEMPEAEKKTISTIKRNSPIKDSSIPKSTPMVDTSSPATSSVAQGSIKAPLPGVILDIVVNVGDTVKKGQKVAVLEAMKMENSIESDRDGKVIEIKVKKGDSILEGNDIVVIG